MGRGSIQKIEGKRGPSYKVIYDAPPDLSGARKQRTKTFRTRREADRFLLEVRHQIESRSYVAPSRETVATTVERYLEAHSRRVKRSSLLRYRSFANRINKSLGGYRLDEISPLFIQQFFDALDLNPRTIHQCHSFLSAVFDQAVAWRIVAQNPCAGTMLPVVHEEVHGEAWSADECGNFLDETRDHPLHLIFRVALLTGLRRSEILALHWSDVDLDHRVIHVRHTLSRVAAHTWVLSTPKTHSSLRSISFDNETKTILARLADDERDRLPRSAGHEDRFVFRSEDDRPLDPDAVSRAFAREVKRLGLPPITFHGLRATHATLLFERGESPRTVMDRLGHATARMTLERYAHGSPDADRRAAEGVAASLRPGGGRDETRESSIH